MGERAYFSLWFQKDWNPLWWESMAACGRHCCRSGKVRDHSFYHKHRETRLKAGQGHKLWKPAPVIHFLQQGHTSHTAPESATNWNASVQMPKPMGHTPHLTTTKMLKTTRRLLALSVSDTCSMTKRQATKVAHKNPKALLNTNDKSWKLNQGNNHIHNCLKIKNNKSSWNKP